MKPIVFTGDFAPHQRLLADAWENAFLIGNLECAFSAKNIMTGKAYVSVLPDSAMENIEGLPFCALNLANNHVNDAANFPETHEKLKKKFPGIQFFGTRERPFAEIQSDSGKIAVIGCLERCHSRATMLFPEEKVLDLIRKIRNIYRKIYVYPHWGKESEYTRYPSPRQIKLARVWIEAGADGVFGHHSHVYQGRETYRGVPVYFSLGNFFFPHPESALYEGTHDGMTISVNPDSDTVAADFHSFDEKGLIAADKTQNEQLLERISEDLHDLNFWSWLCRIGAFYLRKNMDSWKIRIPKNPLVNVPKFLLWCFFPMTFLSLAAAIWSKKNDKTN